jgi:phage terminase large subunit-like protein
MNPDDIKLYKLFPKQQESISFIEDNKFSLLIGQSRAGKTLAIMYMMVKRALLYPDTNQVIFRHTLGSVVDGIMKTTLPEVLDHFFPILEGTYSINKSNAEITFHNGSRIMFRGLDTSERATKILSQQFSMVFFDEVQTIPYVYFSLLLTRLPQPKDVEWETKIVCSANWAPKTHWSKAFFHDLNNPETKTPHKQRAGFLPFETIDNDSIDADAYMSTLKNAGDAKSRKSYSGDFWFDLDGAQSLWVLNDIFRAPAQEWYDEIIISYDPAVTNTKTSDGHGVAVLAKKNEDYYVLEVWDKREDINVIAKELCNLYDNYGASRIVYETNQGGDFIPKLIAAHNPMVLTDGVRATKGKLLRAEPVAALYKNGKVFHCDRFIELEDQMCNYNGSGASPNALDALVHGITYLYENSNWVDVNAI